MKAAADYQRRLLDLQAVDTALAQVEHRRRTLPETATAQRLHAERGRLAERVVEAETRVADLQADADRAEADIVPVKARRERNQKRVDAGEIGDPKALSAMLEEISHLGRRIGDLEDAELEAMEALEGAQAGLADATAAKERIETELRGVLVERKAKLATLDAEAATRAAERSVIAGALQQWRHVVLLCQQKSPRVKGVWRFFIGQEGQLAKIGGKEIIGIGIAAHFCHIHKPCISHHDGGRSKRLHRHEHAVVPVLIGEKIVEGQASGSHVGKILFQPCVDGTAARARAGIARQ